MTDEEIEVLLEKQFAELPEEEIFRKYKELENYTDETTYKEIKEKYKTRNFTDEEIKSLLEKRIAELSEKRKTFAKKALKLQEELNPQMHKELKLAQSIFDLEKSDEIENKIYSRYDSYNSRGFKYDEKLELEIKDCQNFLDDITFKIENTDLKELSERLDVALKENDRKYIDVLKARICKVIDNKIDELKTTKERIEKL